MLHQLPTSRASERKQAYSEVQATLFTYSLVPECTSQAPV